MQQQDLQKVNTLQLVPSHSDNDYTLGNPAQSLYLGNFGKGKSNEQFQSGFGDNKFSTFNFDPNMFQVEDWNATNSSKLNKQSNYPDENQNINLPSKRKPGARGEDEDLETTKKIKSSPISTKFEKNNAQDNNKLHSFGGTFNANAIPTGSMDIKEEGMYRHYVQIKYKLGNTKKNVEAGRASFR